MKQYKDMSLSELAGVIRRNWPKVSVAAKPYLDAMATLNSIDDKYGSDSGRMIVAYLLCNLSGFKNTPVAKAVKLELNKRLKSK